MENSLNLKPFISVEQIARVVEGLARKIDDEFSGEEIITIAVMKGSIVFFADLIRRIKSPVILDYMHVSSYGAKTVSSGEIVIKKDIEQDIKGRNVLIVEDIIDSGNTLKKLKALMEKRQPKKLKICTLLDKPQNRQAEVNADFAGIEIPDEFVVGYGLDFAEKYRNLPYIATLK